MRVLIHIDQVENWNMVLENTRNMLQYVEKKEEPYQIEIVANGNAVKGLTKENVSYQEPINEILSKQVLIAACQNSLRKFVIEKNALFDKVQIVPAGIIEIVKKQEEGYAYIKP